MKPLFCLRRLALCVPLFLSPVANAQLSPEEAPAALTPGEGLAVDLVLSEPLITQPVFFNFDERGRLWLVQYRQYPWPAGLNVVGRDRYWRALYDGEIPPPPYKEDSPFRGEDRITIHEDTTGDGEFDSTEVFAEGLNITSAVERGRGGVWVLTPPQLVFYPGADKTDRAEGVPEVHLTGFHLEDTHAIANSIRWGVDGWLYGVTGSTVTADVIRPGIDEQPIARMEGQHVWRYHPETRRFEVFAEGGGNAFGLEIDEKGRVFSGDNGGNNRGYHYAQHSYNRKNFGKHGALANPYAFGYFATGMRHHQSTRFTHNFIIYEGAALPDFYRGKLIGIDPMNHWLPVTELTPEGATFSTADVGAAIETDDTWFRPQDIKHGPDGFIYVADWYDGQISHYRNHEGEIDKEHGRLYRIRSADAEPGYKPFDLAEKSSRELVELLKHDNRWYREQARRLLGDRRDASLVPSLREAVLNGDGQFALEALWALNLSGGFDEDFGLTILDHSDPFVRKWAIRLLADDFQLSEMTMDALVKRALQENHMEVRSQLASSAQRLDGEHALPLIDALLQRDADVDDRYLPLLIWWALEKTAESHRDEIVRMFSKPEIWQRAIVRQEIAWRLMRRYAQPATRRNLLTCAALFRAAPDEPSRSELMRGFEQAFEGRSLSNVPSELAAAIAETGGASLALQVRQGSEGAAEEGLALIADPEADMAERIALAQVFGEIQHEQAVPALLPLIRQGNEDLAVAALGSLSRYRENTIANEVLEAYPQMSGRVTEVAVTMLAGRTDWALKLMRAIDEETIDVQPAPLDAIELLRLADGTEVRALVEKHFGGAAARPADEYQQEINRVASVLAEGGGAPAQGRPLFEARCSACHVLHGQGGDIGPELTSWQRDDLDALLLATIHPGAELREGYQTTVVTTRDGARFNGFLADQTPDTLVIRSVSGQDTVINRAEVVEEQAMPRSIMPDGLLNGLTDDELRDLFAYLQSTWATHESER
ncbi:MAG: PVC-type heme-binding CxxCH protein [Opitutales bacterium]